MTPIQIAKAARDAGANSLGEHCEYYKLWMAAREQEIGLYLQYGPDEVDVAVHGLLDTQAACESLDDMELRQPPNQPGVVYLMHRPLDQIDEEETEATASNQRS